ncbi:MAG TPA: hypothetical protein VED01_14150 [Burkholderiales bacterium]|nr:hypothetical protein [Burkholderiales bacterium]
MKRLLAHGVTAALVLIVQGCASGQWTKPGADAAMVNREMEECRKLALSRATAPVAPAGSPAARTDGGRVGALTPAVGSNERFVNEHEDIRRCMIQRGYALQRLP